MEIFPGSSLPADAQEFARRAQRDGGAPVNNQLRTSLHGLRWSARQSTVFAGA